MARGIVRLTVGLVVCVLASSAAWAQQASGIAGVVHDASGGVLPGVTVEAASPALIEKVRTVVTDGQGRYNITELRPGTYSVTFTLTGFGTVKREGVTLAAGFTANINADLQVGAVQESITVTGTTPMVDVQNVRQQKVVASDLLDALPSGTRGLSTFANLIPGMAGTTDVGGSQGTYSSNSPRTNTYHGKAGVKLQYDGMRVNNMVGGGDSTGFMINPATAEETIVETGGVSADSPASGVSMNMVPKEGGNAFRFEASAVITGDKLQATNLTDELRARGLTTVNQLLNLYDTDVALGGPLMQDALWFFTAHRFSGSRQQIAGLFWNKTQGTPVYTPDPDRPADPYERLHSHALRLTWQASQRNKFNFFTDIQTNCTCGRTGFIAPEADTQRHFWPQGLFQATWTSPRQKLLLEGGVSATISHWPTFPTSPLIKPTDISILEQSTSLRYNAASSYNDPQDSDRYAQRVSVAYVTGSHNFRGGVQVEEGLTNTGQTTNGNMSYRFLNGIPNQLTLFATPYLIKNRMKADVGVYAQDQWTLHRLTLSYGLRWDYFNGYVPEQHVPATPFVPFERNFAAVKNVPQWKDWDPRVGASYDLFGNGRTALKVSLGRYLGVQGLAIASANNPITTSANSVNRTWNDTFFPVGDPRRGNFVPDCNLLDPNLNAECGPYSNSNFGKPNVTTRYADDAIHGYGARDYFWDVTTEIQQELSSGISMSAGYYRNWYGNFLATDNVLVVPEDYTPYCITAPKDARLPGGGGYQVCGLYDVAPTKFNQVSNLVTQASNYGTPTRHSDFVNISFNARLTHLRLGGGFDTGRTITDNCFVVDSPQQLKYCHVVTPFKAQTQFKMFGSYSLPKQVSLSGTIQNVSGPAIAADYPATNADVLPSLGRPLAGGANATATVPLIEPQTQFEGRKTQVDIRVSKSFRSSGRMRIQANLDLYNVLNASPILGINTTYGPQWLRPIGDGNTAAVLPARLIQFSGQLTF